MCVRVCMREREKATHLGETRKGVAALVGRIGIVVVVVRRRCMRAQRAIVAKRGIEAIQLERHGGDGARRGAQHLGHAGGAAVRRRRGDDRDTVPCLGFKDVRGSESNCEQDSRKM